MMTFRYKFASLSAIFPAALLLLVTGVCALGEKSNEKSQTFDGLAPAHSGPRPLKALLIAGGCCHDYETQTKLLSEGIGARANIRVDVVWTRDTSHSPPFTLFDDPDWAEGYDFVIHDECAATMTDPEVLGRIIGAHDTVPAVHLHCAMHSFRTEAWHKHVGIASNRHGPHVAVDVEIVDKEHPITKGMEDWKIEKDELYNNVDIYGAHALAMGHQTYQRDGAEVNDAAIVAWTNETTGAPSFSTSLGHFNEVVASDEYLNMITRGALWACGKLDDPFYQQPYTGSNVVTELVEAPKADAPVAAPADSLPVTITAISNQPDRKTWHAIDGKPDTRWCANQGTMPAWLQIEFDKPITITGSQIEWERRDQWMRYKIESSTDGKNWTMAFDASQNDKGGVRKDQYNASNVRFLRLTVLGQQQGLWPSLWEWSLFGEKGALKIHANTPEAAAASVDADEYKEGGNIVPRAHQLSAAEEAEVLKDVAVPEGFTASLFAPWQMANYPTYIAAAPNGDLYVSSDGNASGGRQPGRGRVLRLRDTDADGRADEVTEFVRDIDSPRGLLWDHDRLYLLHPPHITAFHDPDGDGVADSSERLISNIAFGFEDRSADHTTNGLEMGIDGWIYIAVGDFGFMKATGTDGRELQMRGGGVVRFRPDGTGLETFSDGTRNIYGLAISPTLDLLTRDNTNDGGGWNVRLHHLTGLEDHGYPRLYKNFAEETIAPLVDYGGGSGCGAFHLEEPGIPAQWNARGYTVDWGKTGSFRHVVQHEGASLVETEAPAQFIKMTRPTDGDVDGMSAIYQSSWKGPGNFFWAGPDLGYIARVVPSGFKPEPLPDFATSSDAELVELVRSSPSHVRRMAAQRMLLRRPSSEPIESALLAVSADASLPLGNRVAALYAVTQRGFDPAIASGLLNRVVAALENDDAMMPFLTRAYGDFACDVPAEFFTLALELEDPRRILEAIVAAARQNKSEVADAIALHLGSSDPRIAHTAFQALAKLGADEAALKHIGSSDEATRKAASWALMRMDAAQVVPKVIACLESETAPEKPQALISVLARHYHREAEWKGDSWATRPDTRGPYYEPVPSATAEQILAALDGILNAPDVSAEEASHVVAMMGQNRIQNDAALDQIITLAEKDASLVPSLITQLAKKDDIPARAVPLVIAAARSAETPATALKESVRLLMANDSAEAFPAVVEALATLQGDNDAREVREAAVKNFVGSPKLENQVKSMTELFLAEGQSAKGQIAAQGVLKLAEGKNVGPEALALAKSTIDQAWQNRATKIPLIIAAGQQRNSAINDRISAAMNDTDGGVATHAKNAAKRLGIQAAEADKTPKIATLEVADATAQSTAHTTGDVILGEAVFAKATCAVCHTVREDEAQKGPYLGSIAEIYRRNELAEAILDPGKTIAQGFKTNLFTLKDGTSQMGFVTDEAGETVTSRDIVGNETTFAKADIAKRDTLPTSLMPPALMNNFTVHELASLLDYLESLVPESK